MNTKELFRRRLMNIHFQQRLRRLSEMDDKVSAYCILHRMCIGCDNCNSGVGDGYCGRSRRLHVR